MERPPFVRNDGNLDVKGFEAAGISATKVWLEGRLKGEDRYFPIDNRYGEPPYDLVVEILRDLGSGEPNFVTLAVSILELLETAGQESTPFLSNALAICERVRVPAVTQWFVLQLRTLSNHPELFRERWTNLELRAQLVRAASLQVPADISEAVHSLWLRILTLSEYSTIALYAFGTRFGSQVPHLDLWWRSSAKATRVRELKQIVTVALRQDADALRGLNQTGLNWDEDLRASIDSILLERSESPVFQIRHDEGGSPELTAPSMAQVRHLPPELARAKKQFDATIDLHDPVLKAPILLVNSSYTQIPGLEELHGKLWEVIQDLNTEHEEIEQTITKDFSEVTKLEIVGNKRVLYTFPMYLTEDKRRFFSVLPYGKQRALGVLVPKAMLRAQGRFQNAETWNLATFLHHIGNIQDGGMVYCLKNYATSDIVRQCKKYYPDQCQKFRTDEQLRVVSVPSHRKQSRSTKRKATKEGRRTFVPSDLRGDDRVFLFDLGDAHRVQADCNSDPTLTGYKWFSIPHSLNISVGIGFNLHLVPWLLHDERWNKITEVLLESALEIVDVLKQVGVEVDVAADISELERLHALE